MNIYIGNLSYSVKESDLKEVMEDYGTVDSVKLIIDRDTRRSKGFAFVETGSEKRYQRTEWRRISGPSDGIEGSYS